MSVPADTYRIVRFGGRPVMAIPAGSRALRLAAVRRYPTGTPRRALLRRGLGFLVGTGLDRALGTVDRPPLQAEMDFSGWLAEVRAAMDRLDARAVVIYPAQAGRNRLYIHLLDGNGSALGFGKIAFDEYNNERLDNEGQALSVLHRQGLRHSRAPRVLARGRWQGHGYLVVEALPPGAGRPVAWPPYPADAVNEFAGDVRVISEQELRQLAWWKRFEAAGAPGAFTEQLARGLSAGLPVRRIHGDLGSWNLFWDAGELWIIDWEMGDASGPALTDQVAYWLGEHHRRVLDEPAAGAELFRHAWLEGADSCRCLDVMAALAFLHGARYNAAVGLVARWKEGSGG